MQTQAQHQVQQNQELAADTHTECLRLKQLTTYEGRRCIQTLIRSAIRRFHAAQITTFHRWRLFAAGERFELLEEHMHAAREEQSMVDGIRRLQLVVRLATRRRAHTAFRRWHRKCSQLAASEWAREVTTARTAAEHSMHLAVQRLLMQRVESGADCLMRAMRLVSMRLLRVAWRLLATRRAEKRSAEPNEVCLVEPVVEHRRNLCKAVRAWIAKGASRYVANKAAINYEAQVRLKLIVRRLHSESRYKRGAFRTWCRSYTHCAALEWKRKHCLRHETATPDRHSEESGDFALRKMFTPCDKYSATRPVVALRPSRS